MSARILMVEDERIVALHLQHVLEGHGYEVVGHVVRGDQVLARALELRPDLVLMDVRLEGQVDGIEAAQQVKATLDVPVVFLSAQSDADTVRRMHEAGADSYLIKPFDDRQIPRVLDAALDRHRSQRAVRERGDELWVTLQSIGDAVVTVGAQGSVTHLNPAAERLTGLKAEAARGMGVTEALPLFQGRDGPRAQDPTRAALLGEAGSLGPGIWLHPHRGAPRPVRDTTSPIRAGDGRTVGAVLVLQDLGEREQVQHVLAQADRVRAMGAMAASIAHEINNPLTYVLGNLVEALACLEETGGNREIVALLRDARLGATAIERIVQDLKLLSTPDHRTVQAIDVRDVVQRRLGAVAGAVRARGRLESALGETSPVQADPVALGQVVWNLVDNAAHALPTPWSADSVVRVTTRDVDDTVVITVTDNGCGIPDDVLERIYDPFFTTRPVGEGAGLGLPVARQIVQGMGGSLRLTTAVGRGTRVEVALPAEVAETTSDELVAEASDPGPRRHVLLIDDDRLVRRAVQGMLARHHQVHAVGSVEAALAAIAQEQPFDAVLCDLMMSPLNGVEFVEALQDQAADLVGRVAFITGGVVTGDLQERVIRTGRPVLYKPFPAEQALSLVRDLADAGAS